VLRSLVRFNALIAALRDGPLDRPTLLARLGDAYPRSADQLRFPPPRLCVFALKTDDPVPPYLGGEIGSGSVRSSSSAGRPAAAARSKAGANSAVRVTTSPYAPNASA
jgi:hypothetical protein